MTDSTGELLKPQILWAHMRDGIKLYSELYIQGRSDAQLPAVMMRSPYNGSPDTSFWAVLCRNLASQGYAVINQAVRGTHNSEGVFTPYSQEQEDGYDAVEWAAAQPWCDGRVGLWGFSYLGAAALHASVAQPPHLVGVSAHFAPSDCHDNAVYENGVFNLHFMDTWSANLINDFQRKAGIQGHEIDIKDISRRARTPLSDRQEFGDCKFYFEFLEHPYYDEFWSRMDLERRYSDINVQVQLTGGWFDIFSVGTLRNYRGIRTAGGPRARDNVHLRMVPACHGVWASEDWKFEYSPIADTETLSMGSQWWHHIFRDGTPASAPAPVQLYVMAPPMHGNIDIGFWISSANYPLPNTTARRLFLGSEGKANSLSGDGTLNWSLSEGAPDTFIHEITTPVPTCGGNLLPNPGEFPKLGDIPGPRHQGENESRLDVLVYTSKPQSGAIWIIGPVSVTLWAQTSAVDTDFTVKLVVVRPDGVALNVLDRVVNSQLRNGSKRAPERTKPGEASQYFLDLGDTALKLEPGMRLRLEVASSNYPRFALNSGTGGSATDDGRLLSATQTIFHDAAHPSSIVLPLIDGATLSKGL
ncbi:CocE/NonD hydrolase [Cadophora sp. DSE1049]|nr:CocE/NonD hydrolase [Cadophora sp. DSE1049]